MSVDIETARSSGVGDGIVTAFPYGFLLFTKNDIAVYIEDAAGVQTLQVVDTDYTVDGLLNDSGGNVNFVTAPLSGVKVEVFRDQALTQILDVRNQGAAFRESLETQYDKLIMVDQSQQDQLNRSYHIPESEVGSDLLSRLPKKADRLGKVLGWGATNGEPIAVAALPTSTVVVTSYMETVLDDGNSGIARATLEIADEIDAGSNSTNQNNYTGFTSTAGLTHGIITATGDFNFTGFTGGVAGRRMLITNEDSGAANVIRLKYNDALSSAANQIDGPNGGTLGYSILPGETVLLVYDATVSKWLVVGDYRGQILNLTGGVGAVGLAPQRSGDIVTNLTATGLKTANLPAAADFDDHHILKFTFTVLDADGIRIDAPAGKTIQVGPLVTPSGGQIESLVIGSSITLAWVSVNQWVAVAKTGVWNVV